MMLGLSRLAVLLLCFVVAVHGYISALDYYAAGELRASYQTPGGSNDIKGLFVIEYRAKSKRLNYKVAVNLISVGDVTINGPARCLNRANGGSFSQTDPNCIYNTGPVVFKLGTGIVPKDGEDATNQYFEGSRSLNSVEEAMLFNSELYILVNTILPDPETQKEVDTPILRGGITVRVQTDTSLVSILSFVNSPKDFDSSIQRVKTGNQGLGYLFYNADNTNLGVRIFTTMKQAGSYLLKCGGRSKVLASGQSQVATNVNFNEAADTPMLLESLVKGQCYVFITSAEAVDGDIFAWVEGVRTMENILVGTKMDPPTNSPYLAYASIYFDQGDKTLDILVRHNITEGVTGASVHTNGGAPLCDLMNNNNFPLRSFCRLNETHLEDLTRGRIYITLSTEANPNGEVRGPIVFNGKATTFSGSAGSSSLAIGLGVGLGVGIPVLILAIVGIVFLAKRGGSTGKI